MTRRESVRVLVFARGSLVGSDRAVRCALVNVSAAGALLSFLGRAPEPPLRLEFELSEIEFSFVIDVIRVPEDGGLVVAFPRPHSEALYRVLAVEQRRALAHGRVNISERRMPPSYQTIRGVSEDRGTPDDRSVSDDPGDAGDRGDAADG
jgi:hypothetical protein